MQPEDQWQFSAFDRGQDSRNSSTKQFNRQGLKRQLENLAIQGVFVGTSSWKYPGWCGTLYDRARYEFKGKFAQTRFNRHCLSEYAEVFKTVCVDAAYYNFPSQQYLQTMVNQTPEDFQFAFKVTDAITIKNFPQLERFGEHAGKPNKTFLDVELFMKGFLQPCEIIRANVGLLIFEFSRFWQVDYQYGREFIADLDKFLTQLPKGWPYAVEMRNRAWLKQEYFDCLKRHQVSHVFNSWEAMPPVHRQMALPGSRTNPQLIAARFLLASGRQYEEAVKKFEPYDSIREENLAARTAGTSLIDEGLQNGPKRRTFVFVNNRLEGNAPGTISAMLGQLPAHKG